LYRKYPIIRTPLISNKGMPPSIGTGSFGFGGKPGSSSSFADLFCAEVKSVSLDDCLSAAEKRFSCAYIYDEQ